MHQQNIVSYISGISESLSKFSKNDNDADILFY